MDTVDPLSTQDQTQLLVVSPFKLVMDINHATLIRHTSQPPVLIAFVFLPSTSLTIFRMFQCSEYVGGQRLLEADLQIDCDR